MLDEPVRCASVVYVVTVDQGDQHIDVEQIRHQGSSTRSRLTSSIVIIGSSGRSGNGVKLPG